MTALFADELGVPALAGGADALGEVLGLLQPGLLEGLVRGGLFAGTPGSRRGIQSLGLPHSCG